MAIVRLNKGLCQKASFGAPDGVAGTGAESKRGVWRDAHDFWVPIQWNPLLRLALVDGARTGTGVNQR